MRYYAIAEVTVTDPSWVADYVAAVTPMVERWGGRYLARTPKVERLEGNRDRAALTLILEWPSREAALDFYQSEEYRPHRDARQRGSIGEFALVAGEDVTGASRGAP